MKNNYMISFLSTCLIMLTLFATLTLQYKEMIVESDQLCSIMKKNKVKLGDNHNSAVLVKQTLLNSHSLKWRTNFHCSFQILAAHPKEGIFAVIQQLVFRINSTTDECIDYVQFKAKDGSTSQKYCGRFNADLKMDYYFSDSVALKASGNSFIDPKGELDVHIFVSRDELQSGEEMDMTMAFTAYKYCAGDNSGWSRSDWVPCGDSYKDVCIYRDFINDGYVNCPYPGCVDEGGCSKRVEQEQNDKIYLGNKVFIGSISTLAVVFVIFVLFIWACKKHKILCWAEAFAHPSARAETIAPPRASEMIDQTGERLSQSHLNQPSAPSLDEDKDLPPSYESLFPER